MADVFVQAPIMQLDATATLGAYLVQVAENMARLDAEDCTATFRIPTPRGELVMQATFTVVQPLPRVN